MGEHIDILEQIALRLEGAQTGIETERFIVNGTVITNGYGHDRFVSTQAMSDHLRNLAAEVRAMKQGCTNV